VLCWAETAGAAAEVHRFSFVVSANPSQIDASDFNKVVIDNLNTTLFGPRGLQGLGRIGFGWFFDTQLRYFVRPNVAVEVGAGQLRSITKREYLPRLAAAIQYRAEVLSVPVHAGAAYYLPPYNQGDFQARVYVGGGFTSLVYNRARLQAEEFGTDSATTLGGSFLLSARRDSPGYYLETGVHMFFAARYSVMIGALYRSSVVRRMDGEAVLPSPNGRVIVPLGPIFDLDTSGLGGRFALAIGF
jgi:hypothetical protein